MSRIICLPIDEGVYFNDNDLNVVQWLRNAFPKGVTDERSIKDVKSHDLQSYKRVHLFAGIGGWELALNLAGWKADRSVWTGSCPCQPFSSATQGSGERDKRHLWPEMRRLIAKHLPSTIFGEQVASKAGRVWFSRVRADLETLGYAVGAADLCAASIGAPHIRQRIFFVADTTLYARGFNQSWRNKEDRIIDWWNRKELDHWKTTNYGYGADGKKRRIEPGIKPMVNGVSKRMVKLRGYGNAIVPQLACLFIQSYLDI
jgi:DNA (cytosine-5)-methyltransferase 1